MALSNYAVTMGRSRNVWGPYEPDPNGPLVTSQPKESNERADDDHLKPRYLNPDSVLQKSGHGSYADLPNGETYLVHLTSRPFMPELRCTLDRETAIQKMTWTDDGWLRMADGSNLAKLEVEEPNLPDVPMPQIPWHDDFDGEAIGNWYYSPRQMPTTFANVTDRPGWLRIRITGRAGPVAFPHDRLGEYEQRRADGEACSQGAGGTPQGGP